MGNAPILEGKSTVINCTANTDLSAYLWKGVQITGSFTVKAPFSGTDGLTGLAGILETAPSQAGEQCRVCIFGVTKGVVDSTSLYAGEPFCMAVNNANPGLLEPVSSCATFAASVGVYWVSGYTLEAGVESQVVNVFLRPYSTLV